MSGPLSLVERHRAARLLHELSRPASAAVIAHLPLRPGTAVSADVARHRSALSIKQFWATVSRLEALGVLERSTEGLSLARDQLNKVVDHWVADSPLYATIVRHPRIRPFVQWGRVTSMPTDSDLVDEMYVALAELFDSGERLVEAEVNARIANVHDDPAEVRRGLVDRGLLHRTPGTAVYRRP
jgi:hypothetical protein